MTVRHLSAYALAMLAVFVFWLGSCSSDNSPTDPGGGGGTPQDSLGVLLEGPATDPALSHTISLPPSPANETDITDSALITTRLEAIIAPGATVGQVNDALTAIGATIVGMAAQVDLVSLRIPPIATADEADSLCTELTGSAAFLFAYPAIAAGLDRHPVQIPTIPDDTSLYHLIYARAPAAWNARRLLTDAANLTVLVPDIYWALTPNSASLSVNAQIPNHTFLQTYGNATSALSNGSWVGNHGFHVCGIIAAKWDGANSTGVHPMSEKLITTSLPLGGYSWSDILVAMWQALPATGPFIVSTSIGYNDPQFKSDSKDKRLILALAWRKLVGARQSDFLHFASAGNDGKVMTEGGEAVWNSPFCTARKVADVTTLIPPGSIPEVDRQKVMQYYQTIQMSYPDAVAALTNTIIVGSSDNTGQEAAYSSRGSDIRTVGTDVYNICVNADHSFPADPFACDGLRAILSGTSMATPQAAGMAAYLHQLAPTQPLSEIRDILMNAYDPNTGFTDLYWAVLSLDQNLNNASIRREILDVAGNTDAPGTNGKFDEHDIKVFLDSLDHYDQLHLTDVDIDLSRYDLNGNSITADAGSIVPFDLDANVPPAYTTLKVMIGEQEKEFDEEFMSDREILCYYAYSNLYQGDEQARDTLLKDCILPYQLFAAMADTTVAPGDSMYVDLRLGLVFTPDTLWEQNATITLNPTNGAAHPDNGITDANGRFSSWLVPSGLTAMEVEVIAKVNGLQVVNDTVRLAVMEPTWVIAEPFGGASSYFEIEDIYLGIVDTGEDDSSGIPGNGAVFATNVAGGYQTETCDAQVSSGGKIQMIGGSPYVYTIVASAGDTAQLIKPDDSTSCGYFVYSSSDAGGRVIIRATAGSILVSTTMTIDLVAAESDSGSTAPYAAGSVYGAGGSVDHQLILDALGGNSASQTFEDVLTTGQDIEISAGAYSTFDLYDIGYLQGTYKSSARIQVQISIAPL